MSDQRMVFFQLRGGMLSAWGGGNGLVWILPEQELPKLSLKSDKVCEIRYVAALQDSMSPMPMVLSDVDKYFDTVLDKSS